MDTNSGRGGPLTGLRVLEVGGIGAGPFCAMLLADMGADVVRIDRAADLGGDVALFGRGKRSVALDLKAPGDLDILLALAERADVLIEAFRPGVAERLGFGPDT